MENYVAIKQLEVWADSFKEGEWFVTNLATQLRTPVRRTFKYNFQPIFTFYQDEMPIFVATVYGDYKGWDPIPTVIADILANGKPDILLYDRTSNKVFFGVEETAAVPTGNQSLQRLERVWFSAIQQIPFVYLISEYGMHIDGGARRSSIWPSYLALKLSSQYQVPSLTLLYGDATHPEDYAVGPGVSDLAAVSYLIVRDWLGDDVKREKEAIFARIFQEMGQFIQSHASEIAPNLPGRSLLTSDAFLAFVAERTARHEE